MILLRDMEAFYLQNEAIRHCCYQTPQNKNIFLGVSTFQSVSGTIRIFNFAIRFYFRSIFNWVHWVEHFNFSKLVFCWFLFPLRQQTIYIQIDFVKILGKWIPGYGLNMCRLYLVGDIYTYSDTVLTSIFICTLDLVSNWSWYIAFKDIYSINESIENGEKKERKKIQF